MSWILKYTLCSLVPLLFVAVILALSASLLPPKLIAWISPGIDRHLVVLVSLWVFSFLAFAIGFVIFILELMAVNDYAAKSGLPRSLVARGKYFLHLDLDKIDPSEYKAKYGLADKEWQEPNGSVSWTYSLRLSVCQRQEKNSNGS